MFSQKFWCWFGRKLVAGYAKVMFKLDVVRHAPLPAGPKIIAINHPTTTDPAVILTLLNEPASIMISETLFKVPVLGAYLRRAGHVTVVHSNGRASLEEAIGLLKAGRTVVIFPEGAISPLDGGFHAAHTGVARLALSAGAPVIPVGIALDRERIRLVETMVEGKPEVGAWYLRGPYAWTIGKPMRFNGNGEDRLYVRQAAEQVMERIKELAYQSAVRLNAAPVGGAISRPAAVVGQA